jgi:hypothetical protein
MPTWFWVLICVVGIVAALGLMLWALDSDCWDSNQR